MLWAVCWTSSVNWGRFVGDVLFCTLFTVYSSRFNVSDWTQGY